jgi:predicted nucleotidyltransferase
MTMPDRDEILGVLEREGAAFRKLGVRRLGLFGSAARGSSGAQSDLDFVVEFEAKSFDRYMDLKLLLERLFGCRVDLVLSDVIKPRLRKTILGEAVYAEGL